MCISSYRIFIIINLGERINNSCIIDEILNITNPILYSLKYKCLYISLFLDKYMNDLINKKQIEYKKKELLIWLMVLIGVIIVCITLILFKLI